MAELKSAAASGSDAGCGRAAAMAAARWVRARAWASAWVLAACAGVSVGQAITPPANGPKSAEVRSHALVGVRVHVSPGVVIEDGAVVVREGRIEAVGERGEVRIPAGFRVHELDGLEVYAGFIDPFVEVETPAPGEGAAGGHWNGLVTPERDVLSGPGMPGERAERLRSMGYVAAGIAPEGGIFAGRGAVVSLVEQPGEASGRVEHVIRRDVFNAMNFQTGGWGDGSYPTSHPGCVAVMRQALIDADWQRAAAGTAHAGPGNALTVLADASVPLWIDTTHELEALLGAEVAAEFGRPAVIVGSGREFRRLEAMAGLGLAVVVPMVSATKPDVSSVGAAEAVELEDLMAWEQQPTNAERLMNAGMSVSLQTSVPRGQDFMDNVREAIAHGLSEERALAAMTVGPAQLLGLGGELGTVEVGKRASLVVTDGPIFESSTKVRSVWIDGREHEISRGPGPSLDGRWAVRVGPAESPVYTMTLTVTGTGADKPGRGGRGAKASFADGQFAGRQAGGQAGGGAPEPGGVPESGEVRKLVVRDHTISFLIDDSAAGGSYVMSGTLVGEGDGAQLLGAGMAPDQSAFTWTATRAAEPEPEPEAADGAAGEAAGDGDEGEAGEGAGEPDGAQAAAEAEPDGDESDKPEAPLKEIHGEWRMLAAGKHRLNMTVGDDGSVKLWEMVDGVEVSTTDVCVTLTGRRVEVSFEHAPFGMPGRFVLRGTLSNGAMAGRGERSDGKGFEWHGVRPEKDAADLVGGPFGPYTVEALPEAGSVLIVNATVWTSGPLGIIENGGVLVQDGRIAWVGAGRPARVPAGTVELDASGKHVTPGLIDCHSHTGLGRFGINEVGQAVTAEVRIGDSLDPGEINLYRQLAQGVTAVNSLHGSANPIGGQSQTHKLRWGVATPAGMRMEGAKPGIKFALGENVKQSNWGDAATGRYPRSRMGVETIIRDRFQAAREYARARLMGGGVRRDLELEALAEVLAGERLVHCHSYRQDEILMLCRVAEDFGFTIGTFQHGLEVYKVAEAVREVSLGASIFSDWWAYKMEVMDAIPGAGPLQTEAGVVTSYNSDSDELARRMNIEAGKAIKYARRDADGNPAISPAEALKFVTINPAIQLGVGDRIGSLEPGKDADLVIWSGEPMSTLSVCERVMIDGREYYSLEQDRAHRERIRDERRRLIHKILESPKPETKAAPGAEPASDAATDPSENAQPAPVGVASGRRRSMTRSGVVASSPALAMMLERIERGEDPMAMEPGDCGCGIIHHEARWRAEW